MEYILVASFDIDKGSIMEHQYPNAISGDENMLAELMLPDQAHARKEDWTIFFLHKDAAEGEDSADGEDAEDLPKDSGVQSSGEESIHAKEEALDDVEGGEGAPLIYVLNLVNTKYDPTAKRYGHCSSDEIQIETDAGIKRRHRQGYGDLHTTFILAYLQGGY